MATQDPPLDAQRRGEALARQAFDTLTLPDVVTVDSIVAHVATLRGRPIRIVELPALAGTTTCGWWNERVDRDEILIVPPLSPRHGDALVLHEIGHLILDHAGLVSSADTAVATLPPSVGVGGGVIRAQRSHFSDSTEIAAELLADALARAIRRGPARLNRFLSVFS